MSFQLFDVNTVYEQDKDLKRSDVKILQEWVRKQPHLPDLCEQQLILFLHCCYYSIEKAKKILDLFFTLRSCSPELYNMPSIEVLKKSMTLGVMTTLPKKTPEGYSVVMSNLLDGALENFDHVEQINFLDKIVMLQLHQFIPAKGVVIVMDMKKLSFDLLTRINMTAVKKNSQFSQEALPIRIKSIHYINVSPLVHKLVAMVRPFMKKEILEMVNFHTSLETLYQRLPKHILPEDYGGEEPPLITLHEECCKNLLDNLDFFRWLEAQKVDETKRLGKSKIGGEVIDLHGTFKKLEID